MAFSPAQVVIKSTFIEFRDEGVDANDLSDEEFMLPQRARALSDSILECGNYSSRSSDAIASDDGESNCGREGRTRAASVETETNCDSHAPLSDTSHSEDEVEAEDMTGAPATTVPMQTGQESQDVAGQISCTDASMGMPVFSMPAATSEVQQDMPQFVFCYMPGTAFYPMYAVPNGMQPWGMQYPVMQTVATPQTDDIARRGQCNAMGRSAMAKGRHLKEILVKIQLDVGGGFIETAPASWTVGQLKTHLKRHLQQEACIKELFFADQVLEDSQTLEAYGVPDNAVLNGVVGEVTLTTIMLRNIPNDYSREDALELLDSKGFAGLYDFFYLPVDFDRGANMGYAFVNFISHEDAVLAKERLEGFSDWTVASQKTCEVSWGNPLQGREAHVNRYRNSPVMHENVPDHFRPLIFDQGVRVPFLAPTKRFRAPRRR